MEKYETTTLFIAIFAIVISIGSAIYSGILSEKHASSDHKAKEQVKADTARLLSTLRSLMHKGALSSTTKENINIQFEKDAISEFMNSQTGFAYYSWVDQKSAQAEDEGKQGESWRVFFLYLAELVNTDNAIVASRRAADVELLFDELAEEDVEKIANFNSDLIKAISEISKNREGNIIVKTLVESQKERQEENSVDRILAKLTFLKNLGVDDPNVDMFLATITDDTALLEEALKEGADPTTTDRTLLRKYQSELTGFNH